MLLRLESQMSALAAVNLGRQCRFLSAREAKKLRRWFLRPGYHDPPPRLGRAVLIVFLLRYRPPTPSVH
jgi:hypothetical protein